MAQGPILRQGAVGVFQYFTRHRTAANLLMILMLAAGAAALPRMHTQFFPDVVVDSVTVNVAWPGAGAEDVDAAILQVLEPALMAVEGVAGTSARASEGRATITVELEPGVDSDRVANGVQDALDLVRTLPEDAEDPVLRRSGWSDRVTNVVVTGPVALDQLARFADEFAGRLYDAGITRATIQGISSPQVTVEVPSLRLVQHGLTLEDVARAIGTAITADPAGDLAGGGQRVRTGAERRSADDIAALALRTQADGTVLTVGDIATVRAEGIDRGRAYFVGDQAAITLRVDRPRAGDAIAIQDTVERLAAEMTLTLPAGTRIELANARADVIQGRLWLLLENGAMGLALVVAILFLFLNARTALWVAAGIPVAMLSAIAVMWALGMSLNMISLFALIITLGIVVDDAIVVGEHADYRHRVLGESPAQAAENAASRMAMPVFAASITTITAFAGLIVVGGRFGELIADIPWTVMAVLVMSTIECFLILPHHMRHALAGSARQAWYDWPSRTVNRGFDWARERGFKPLMRIVVWARYPILAGLVWLLAAQAAVFLRGDVPWRFFASPEQGTLTGNFAMLPGATRADTLAMMHEVQGAATRLAARLEGEHGTNPIVHMLGEVGGNTGRPLAAAANRSADLLGSVTIDLIDADFRPYSSFEFTQMLQDEVARHPRLDELSFRSFGTGPGGDSLSVDLFGAEADVLKAAAEALKAALAPFPEITGLEDSLPWDREELVLELTPQGRALGFAPEHLARELRQRLTGIEAATFPDGFRTGSIRVALPEPERAADFLDSTLMRSPQGRYVPLADLVSVQTRQGFSTIQRENGVRLVTVSGNLSDDDPARARDIQGQLQADILPRLAQDFGLEFRLSGLAQQEQEFLSDATLGLIACLSVIYLTLAWVFSSWSRPLIVMAVIPFGMIGVIYGHWTWDMAMSMFSVVGMMGMAGIIINDSIVLVTTADEYAANRGLIPSIVDAAADRLRPVLLTTLTTVLGLGPLLFERSNQAQFLQPTVISLVYGLGFGMVLVLLIVPSLLAVAHDLGRMRDSLRRALRLPGRPVGVALRWVPVLATLWLGLAWALTVGWGLLGLGAGPLTALAGQGAGIWPALLAFALWAGVGLAALWLTGVVALSLGRKPRAPTPAE